MTTDITLDTIILCMESSQVDASGEPGDETIVIDGTSSEPVTEAIVHAVASLTERDPLELRPLFDVLDPDAIEGIFDRSVASDPPATATLTFTYEGCTVSTDGVTVRATPIEEQPPL